MPLEQQTLNTQPNQSAQGAAAGQHVPEKYLIAFVIQGDDVFKITADNIIHTTGTADGPAFDAIAKLKAAAALLELTNRHKERPEEIKKMARELAGEGMKMMAYASSSIRATPPPAAAEDVEPVVETQAQPVPEPQAVAPQRSVPFTPPTVENVRPLGPAPVPKPQERTVDDFFNPTGNGRISLIQS